MPISLRGLLSALSLFLLLAGARFAQGGVPAAADLSVLKVDDPDPVSAGSALVYTLTLSNKGPDDASGVELSDPLPAGTTFQSVSAPAGWSCTTPAVGAGGTVSCSAATFAVGSAVFTVTAGVGAGVTNGTVLTNTATVTSATPDPNPGSESATADTTVSAPVTTFSFTKTATPDPVLRGSDLIYTLTATNSSGGDLESAVLTDTLPAGTTFVSLAAPGGWSCTAPSAGGTGTVTCSAAPWAAGSAVFTLTVHVDPAQPAGSSLSNVGSLEVTDNGRTTTQVASATTQVVSPALVTATKTVTGQLQTGGTLTYTVVLSNSAATAQSNNPGDEFTDVLPAELTLVSVTATSGTALAIPAANTVTWNGTIPGNGSVTITITASVKASTTPGTAVSNQGIVAYDADGNGTNEAAASTDDPQAGGAADPTIFVVGAPTSPAEVPALNAVGLALLAVLLALGGAVLVRRRAAGEHGHTD